MSAEPLLRHQKTPGDPSGAEECTSPRTPTCALAIAASPRARTSFQLPESVFDSCRYPEDTTISSSGLFGKLTSNFIWLFGPWLIGITLGLLLPRSESLPPPVDTLSAVLGWVYFASWSISFYPQLWSNYRRRSVVGLSLDFQILNFLGFGCYAVYNCAFYWNSTIRRQYARLHRGQLPAVHSNDVFFALHALFLTALILVQCVFYERNGARPAGISLFAVGSLSIAASAWAIAITVFPSVDPGAPCTRDSCPPEALLNWLTWLYFLSVIKLAVTLVKYIPQVVLNCRRRSTVGWSVWNVVLDAQGGVLSIGQQLMDAATCDTWLSPITGNPVKFLLGAVSLFFDGIFIVQHFCLFPDARRQAACAALDADFNSLETAALMDTGENRREEEGSFDLGGPFPVAYEGQQSRLGGGDE